MSQMPSSVPPSSMGQRPHRGGVVLTLGILGLVLCFICGIFAWVMGRGDLRDMEQGRMDPSGRGITQAGMILGIVGTSLQLLGIVIWFLLFGLAILGAALGGAAPGAKP